MVLHHLLVDTAGYYGVIGFQQGCRASGPPVVVESILFVYNTVKWFQLKHTAKCIVFTCVYEGIGCGQHGSQTKINALLVRLVFSSIYISF